MGDHSEAIQIDFDPEVTSYEQLLEEFTQEHNPCRAARSGQYRSAVFVHSASQREAAEQALQSYSFKVDQEVRTAIEQFSSFTLAEAYHQKYRLRYEKPLMADLELRYPTLEALLASPTITRANAFDAGHGSEQLRAQDLPRMALSSGALDLLR